MPNITSFKDLDTEIQKLGGKPKVLEALWDGDTAGWCLILYVYISKGWFLYKNESRHYLGNITLGGDLRLFNDEVPPWPEADLAKKMGAEAKAKYYLTFYIPSEEPDDNCPSWHERYKGINCADCSKLIIPTTSPYLPKDICYNCHLRREFSSKGTTNSA